MKRGWWLLGVLVLLISLAGGCSREPAVLMSGSGEEIASPDVSVPESAAQTLPQVSEEFEPTESETEMSAEASDSADRGSLQPPSGKRTNPSEEGRIISESGESGSFGESEEGSSGEGDSSESREDNPETESDRDPAESRSDPKEETALTETWRVSEPETESWTTAAWQPPGELDGQRLEGVDYERYLPVPDWVGRGSASASLASQYGGYYTKSAWAKVVYITFCMDYENGYTYQMMDTLASLGVRAAFFITGTYLANRPDMAAAILNRGHVLGSHSYRHRYTNELSDVELINDFVLSEQLFENVLGYDLKYYRPAYGFITERDMWLAQRYGFITTMFSFYYKDYDLSAQPGKWEALDKLKSGLQPGAVYYLHVTPCNIQALPEFVAYAKSLGYSFLRLDQEPGMEPVEPTGEPTTEPPTESTTEAVTEATEPGTEETMEAETEEVTDPPEESSTEPETGESTESETKEATDPATEEATEPETEEATDLETEEVTEPPEESSTEPETEIVTEPETEEATEAETEPPTEPTSEALTEATEPETEPPEEETSDSDPAASEAGTE